MEPTRELVHIHPGNYAGHYPGSEQVHLVSSFAPDGTLLGAQGVGRDASTSSLPPPGPA